VGGGGHVVHHDTKKDKIRKMGAKNTHHTTTIHSEKRQGGKRGGVDTGKGQYGTQVEIR